MRRDKMQSELIRNINQNKSASTVLNYSRRKKLILGLLPLTGFLIVLFGISYDLYVIGEGNISPVSKAAWELYSTDKKIVMFSELPEKYLVLTKNVDREDKLIETLKQHNWKHIENYKFKKNGFIVEIEIDIHGRQFAILELHKVN